MALLFVFYFNPATREAVEMAGIISKELKKAMSINHRRNNDGEKGGNLF